MHPAATQCTFCYEIRKETVKCWKNKGHCHCREGAIFFIDTKDHCSTGREGNEYPDRGLKALAFSVKGNGSSR